MADDPSDAPSAGLVDPPTSWAGSSISFVPVDHDPFNDAWANDRFNAAGPNGDPVDPSRMLPSYGPGQSMAPQNAFGDSGGPRVAGVGPPTNWSAPSISFVPVDHDPFNDGWASHPFNASSTNGSSVDPSGTLPFNVSGQSLAPLQGPFGAGVPAFSTSSGAAIGLPESPGPSAPWRSVLFNRLPASWDSRASGPDAASQDQIDPRLAASGLPLSKSGVPFVPTPPYLAGYPRTLAHWLAPNIVDYFTEPTPPPQWVFPSIPGKIRSNDNPYAGQALLEAASFLGPGPAAKAITLPGLPLLRAFARIAEESVPGAAAKILEATGVGPLATQIDRATLLHLSAELGQLGDEELARIGKEVAGGNPQVIVGRYEDLSENLPPGIQADHFNQQAVYGQKPGNERFISKGDGLSVAQGGNVLIEPDRSHSLGHQYLEFSLWDQFRQGGSREGAMPTNAEYGMAKRRSLLVGGVSPAQSSDIAEKGAAERVARGFLETDPVPRIPGPIFRFRR